MCIEHGTVTRLFVFKKRNKGVHLLLKPTGDFFSFLMLFTIDIFWGLASFSLLKDYAYYVKSVRDTTKIIAKKFAKKNF